MDGLSQKLRRGSIRYNELKQIVKAIGYKIEFIKEDY